MTHSLSMLSKRTKQEILEEFEKLQNQLEDSHATGQTVHSQPALELMEKAKTKTPQTIDKMFADFQASLHAHLSDVRTSLLEQSTALSDLQKAVELSRQQLELQRQITLAADTLDVLVEDHARRTAAFEMESEKRKRDLDEQIALKKKAWEREIEEYDYHKKLKQERDQTETQEREKALSTREAAIQAKEQEITQMKKTVEQFPKDLENALQKREDEVTQRLNQQFLHEKALLEKETSAQIRLLEMNVKNLSEQLAKKEQETAVLRQQTEEANAKAQTLAIKAIERPTTIVAPASASTPPPPPYHDRERGRSNQ